ncbi:MAG TPA: LbtU family siderophore porin [Gammaproteobacteria bacterium]|jgi:hypothetical protein|nr:LbtU family siderophore porin [Gammaproteobacteria bacterium]
MKAQIKPLAFAMLLTGFTAAPVFADTVTVDSAQLDQINAQTKSLKSSLASLQKQVKQLKAQQAKNKNKTAPATADAPAPSVRTIKPSSPQTVNQPEYLPFDLDVPGQAFVSTGPYVGVPYQFAGGDLVVNSPSVNTDLQLLSIRKSIHNQLMAMGDQVFKEPSHSHLLLSGTAEVQGNYTNNGGAPSTTNIDVTNVALDAFFMGPSDWTLGFIEFDYNNGTPATDVFGGNSQYTVADSRLMVNKAFITIGNFSESPFYTTFGQMYVPFGTYQSLMITDTLPKVLGRTKSRAVEVGFMQQGQNAFYGSTYIFRGDSHAASVDKVNNGGLNLGYKFSGVVNGTVGGGVIANLADSVGFQTANNFQNAEQIVHRVPGYNLNATIGLGSKWDLIAEYVTASTRFNPNDMAYNGHGAKPSAIDTQLSYAFPILDNKPSAIGIGYSASSQAMAMGMPLNRYSLVMNTSLWRNTLQAIELRHDREYAASTTGGNAGSEAAAPATGKYDNAITASFDYYF